MLTDDQINDIIDEIVGSSVQGLPDALEICGFDFDSLDPEDIVRIEDAVFFCGDCGNWHLIDDMSEEVDMCRWCFDFIGSDDETWEDEED
jgi:hypothetical protein